MNILIWKLLILRLDWIEHVDEGCIEDYELAASTNDKKNKRQNEVDEDDEDENKKKFKTNWIVILILQCWETPLDSCMNYYFRNGNRNLERRHISV